MTITDYNNQIEIDSIWWHRESRIAVLFLVEYNWFSGTDRILNNREISRSNFFFVFLLTLHLCVSRSLFESFVYKKGLNALIAIPKQNLFFSIIFICDVFTIYKEINKQNINFS